MGLVVSVQSSSVGKYTMLFSGCLSSYIAHRLMNSRQVLSQLACVLDLHETQCRLPLLVQSLVRWFPPHVPQVSSGASHVWALCSQPLHLRHWRGSCLDLSALVLAPQISNPSLMERLATSAKLRVRIACALVCPACLLMVGLIQRILCIECSGRLFTSSISLRCARLVGSRTIGTHFSRTWYFLSLRAAPVAKPSIKLSMMPGSLSQSALSLAK